MASSLESLVGNLGLEKLIQTKKEFGEKVKLISRKGIYPYDYMNGIKKFSEEKLPQKEEFFSKLNDCGISDEDFDHAQRIWKEFGMKNLGEYHDLYLKSDVLLLADVFEEFRNVCMENYSLDPAWYYTSPGLSWDALLKHSGVSLELLTDPDILLLFEKGIRGGISMISNRFGKANNKFMGDNFDPSQPSKYLAYLGKTMENIRNRVDVKLVNNRGATEKLSAKPNFNHLTIFDENLVAVHMKRTKLTFNKPVYCGMAILDISKSLM